MKHLSKAKGIVSAHKGDVFIVFLVYLFMSVLQFLSAEYVPVIGWVLSLIMAILSTIYLCYGLYRIAQGEKPTVGDLFNQSSTFLVENFGKVIGAYLMYMVCLIPAILILVVTMILYFTSLMDAGLAAYALETYTPSITSMVVWFLLLFVEIIAFVIYGGYFNYRFLYKIMYYIDGRMTPVLKPYSKDMLKMACIQFLLCLIPLVGFVLALIWECFYLTKIALDVRSEDVIPSPEPFNGQDEMATDIDSEFNSDIPSSIPSEFPEDPHPQEPAL